MADEIVLYGDLDWDDGYGSAYLYSFLSQQAFIQGEDNYSKL